MFDVHLLVGLGIENLLHLAGVGGALSNLIILFVLDLLLVYIINHIRAIRVLVAAVPLVYISRII
jgi:hypothetical protein